MQYEQHRYYKEVLQLVRTVVFIRLALHVPAPYRALGEITLVQKFTQLNTKCQYVSILCGRGNSIDKM